MIFPWHTDFFQPGRMVCVVFRASPLIWPTSSGAHHAPRPLYKVHPRWFSARGYSCCFTLQPQLRVSPDTIKL